MRINFRVLVAALTLWFVSAPEKTFAQTTYWIPAIKTNGKAKTLDYSVKVHDFFVPWVKQVNERGGGQEVSKTINGTKYTFVQQGFSWDNGKGGSNPTSTGQIRIDNKKIRYESDAWQLSQDFKTQKKIRL